jgi:hypothetical protein
VGFLHARETMEVDRKKQPDVNSLWPNPWLLIAPDFAPEGVLAASRNSIDVDPCSAGAKRSALVRITGNPELIGSSF